MSRTERGCPNKWRARVRTQPKVKRREKMWRLRCICMHSQGQTPPPEQRIQFTASRDTLIATNDVQRELISNTRGMHEGNWTIFNLTCHLKNTTLNEKRHQSACAQNYGFLNCWFVCIRQMLMTVLSLLAELWVFKMTQMSLVIIELKQCCYY